MTDSTYRWSEARDAQLRRLRAEGATWATIADDLGTTRWSAIERGRRIGAPRPPQDCAAPPRCEDDGRHPLPPGHPRTWRAIIDRTLLHGAEYPLPVFRGDHRV